MSPSGCSNVEQISICQDFPLCCVQTKWCGNLDGLASCGIIRVVHRKTSEIDQVQLIGLTFLSGLSPRRVLTGKRKRALPWENPRTTPVFDWGYLVLGWVYTASCVGNSRIVTVCILPI
jgi:hypothetical protein